MGASKETSLSQAERLRLVFGLTEPAIRQAVRWLRLPGGSHGLDAGCGAGCHLELLARHVGPAGRLTGLDLSPENLAAARAFYAGRGLGTETTRPSAVRAANGASTRPEVEFVQGDISRLPFGEAVFDWVWCADTLWAGTAGEGPTGRGPGAVLAEFTRVTKPGGKIALVYWSGQTFLPGHTPLEARLNLAFVEWAPYLAGIPPESQHMRALTWLRNAGLRRTRAKTFLAEVEAPVGDATRQALAVSFDMFWGELAGRVTAADWAEYRRLCDPDSPEFIGDDPDYYAFINYTMFWGIK